MIGWLQDLRYRFSRQRFVYRSPVEWAEPVPAREILVEKRPLPVGRPLHEYELQLYVGGMWQTFLNIGGRRAGHSNECNEANQYGQPCICEYRYKLTDVRPPLRDNEVRIEYNGIQHTFMVRPDGTYLSHSAECFLAHGDRLPCGCQTIPGSGGRSPQCARAIELGNATAEYAQSLRTMGNLDPDEQTEAGDVLTRLKEAEYRHTCICGAFDRPAPRAKLTPSGLRTDNVPYVVLRSHPDSPESLPSKWEGRWRDVSPMLPKATVDNLLSCLKPPCVAVWEDSSKENTEERDGITAVIVYVRRFDRSPQRSEMVRELLG